MKKQESITYNSGVILPIILVFYTNNMAWIGGANKNLWRWIPPALFREIWNRRNRIIFDDYEENDVQVMDRIVLLYGILLEMYKTMTLRKLFDGISLEMYKTTALRKLLMYLVGFL